PEALDRARREPAIRAGIVHELLRWEGPLPTLPRWALAPTQVAGEEIPARTLLLLALASANRDPRVFANPDEFDPDRPVEEIVTFGFGVKFCPGSHLARRELLTALDVVLERLPGLRLVDRAGARPEGRVLRPTPALHVAWDARRRQRRLYKRRLRRL